MSHRRLLLLLVSPALAFASPEKPATDKLEQPWKDAAGSLFKDSYLSFQQLEGREALFGRAITLLMQQPKTDSNIEEAARLFEGLWATQPADEIAISAKFYLGRLEQAHRMPVNLPAARQHFRELIAAHPEAAYAEQALVKLAIIDLYEQVAPAERKTRFEGFAQKAAGLRTSVAKRDLNLLLADVALRFELGQAVALDHLLAADEAGIARPQTLANTWVRIGELARLTGRTEVARTYYGKYLNRFTRDNRRLMIEESLAALPAPKSNREARQ